MRWIVQRIQITGQGIHLQTARDPEQGEMNTDAMHRRAVRQCNPAMQQPALLELQMGDILIVRGQDGKTRQDGIAMVPVVVNHVLAIRRLPYFLGQKLVLSGGGPVRTPGSVLHVQALNFLQKDIKPSWMPPEPFTTVGAEVRLVYETLTAAGEI